MKASPNVLTTLAATGVRAFLCCAAMVGVLSCGGGGGGGDDPLRPERPEGVYSGFSPAPGITLEQALNWEYQSAGGGDGGVGAGADGDGGVGAGGDFGQFRNARVTVRYPDGTLVGGGEARTDANSGMVTIVPRKGYRGPLLLELHGGGGATYYEEGKDTFVDFPAGQLIRAIVPSIDRNIGITPFSEAAFRLLTEGSTAERAANPTQPTAGEIAAANTRVRTIVNQQFPALLSVDDITRLPFIKSPTIGAGSIGIDARGRYGLVNGAFSKQAAMFNSGRTQPTLDAVAHLGADLLDGVLDGMNGNQPAVAAGVRTYDAHTLTGELSSALAEQSYRFGNDESKLALPKILNFANSRYEGYLFDASLTAAGEAFDTVVGWVGDNSRNRTIGQAFNKLPNEARVYSVVGNFGHGSLFFRANTGNSSPKTYVVGDNVNGELGLGTNTSTAGQAVEIQLPGVATHVAGGFGHTLARMADGSVYAWGDNSSGQLGLGNTTSATTPQLVTLPRGALAVAATSTASYALLDDGSVYAWGASAGFGLLGDGNKTSVRNAPAPITALSGIVQISARDNDAVVLRRDGTVLHWGSFPADPTAFTPGDATTPYAGGTPLPTAVAGLPAGAAVRKVLTEQGLFAALLDNGAVYEWGVYFDITANAVLRDLQATRVLSLPPLRDIMPGGFIGYGVRPFDRLTAMGIDYRGGMWKVRGRVAEEFDPANPTLQRRPQGQAPRSDCASCHIALNGWPLTPDPPSTADVCQPPTSIHGGGANGPSLIHAETACEKCHNPGRQPPAPLFPTGWLTCTKGTNLPTRSGPVAPPIVTNVCTIPSAHPVTRPGTVCASCHNSVIARPLNDPALNCAQPQSSVLPSLSTRATISAALNDAGQTIAAGSATTDATPALQGTLSAALQSGQAVRVLRNGSAIGAATLSGTNWSFTDPGAPNGAQTYSARVEAGSDFGPTSNTYAINVDTQAPTQTTSVVVSDDVTGNLANGATTSDTTPTISGTLSAALATGDVVRVLRGGVAIANVSASGTAWTFTEPAALAAAQYAYTARVVDAAGNIGPLSATATVTVVTNLPTVAITRAVNDNNTTIPANGFTTDNTPTLQGTLSAGLGSNQLVRVLRDGTPLGAASVNGTNWTLTDSAGASNGTHTYTARLEQGTVFGAASAGYTFSVDTVAPTQTASVTQISDDISGNLADGASTSDTTPTVSGTLSAALGPNESLQLLRNQTLVATLTPTGTTWTFTEPTALTAATYGYAARVADAAGNVSTAAGSTRSVVINTQFPLAGAATTLSTINGVAPNANGAVPINNIASPVLAGTVQRGLIAAPPGEVVRVYRTGGNLPAANFLANVDGTSWSVTSASLPEGTYTFVARVEQSNNAANFGQPSASVNDPIDLTVPQVTVTATSNVVPFSTVSGAVPANASIVGQTNDPTPTVTIQLSAALGSDTLAIQRNGVAITPSLTQCPGVPANTCFTFTDNPGISIPVPTANPIITMGNTVLRPPVANSYTARVTDAAGNASQGSLTANFDYFVCNQVRANTTFGGTHASVASSDTACQQCHRIFTDTSTQTPITYVSVPQTNPTYWCRRPF
ncbi:MAG TPA: Ig-like domain-containing protein [Burkholderiaceae bacterium]|nr:Ig-like domain-containing protein [Burkholderiaceae bacterium]